jgi:hypothetical protein
MEIPIAYGTYAQLQALLCQAVHSRHAALISVQFGNYMLYGPIKVATNYNLQIFFYQENQHTWGFAGINFQLKIIYVGDTVLA